MYFCVQMYSHVHIYYVYSVGPTVHYTYVDSVWIIYSALNFITNIAKQLVTKKGQILIGQIEIWDIGQSEISRSNTK